MQNAMHQCNPGVRVGDEFGSKLASSMCWCVCMEEKMQTLRLGVILFINVGRTFIV